MPTLSLRPRAQPKPPSPLDSDYESFSDSDTYEADSPAAKPRGGAKRYPGTGEVPSGERRKGGGHLTNATMWTKEEDTLLLELVERQQREKPSWKLVERQMKEAGYNRSVAMARNRFQRIRALENGKTGRNRCKKCGEVKRGHICAVTEPIVAIALPSDVAAAAQASMAPKRPRAAPEPVRPGAKILKPEPRAAVASAGGMPALFARPGDNDFRVMNYDSSNLPSQGVITSREMTPPATPKPYEHDYSAGFGVDDFLNLWQSRNDVSFGSFNALLDPAAPPAAPPITPPTTQRDAVALREVGYLGSSAPPTIAAKINGAPSASFGGASVISDNADLADLVDLTGAADAALRGAGRSRSLLLPANRTSRSFAASLPPASEVAQVVEEANASESDTPTMVDSQSETCDGEADDSAVVDAPAQQQAPPPPPVAARPLFPETFLKVTRHAPTALPRMPFAQQMRLDSRAVSPIPMDIKLLLESTTATPEQKASGAPPHLLERAPHLLPLPSISGRSPSFSFAEGGRTASLLRRDSTNSIHAF